MTATQSCGYATNKTVSERLERYRLLCGVAFIGSAVEFYYCWVLYRATQDPLDREDPLGREVGNLYEFFVKWVALVLLVALLAWTIPRESSPASESHRVQSVRCVGKIIVRRAKAHSTAAALPAGAVLRLLGAKNAHEALLNERLGHSQFELPMTMQPSEYVPLTKASVHL